MLRRRLKTIAFYVSCSLLLLLIYQWGNIFTLVYKSALISYKADIYWKDKSLAQIKDSEKSLKPDSNDTYRVFEVSKLLDDMDINYPSFIWFHTGWIQDVNVGYSSHQWNSNPLKVHVIPFSHNDPGWLMTYEDYFSMMSKEILDVMLHQLKVNKNMTFVWSEVCILKKWFHLLNADQQKVFRRLLREKRFEILTGGWVMPDEAIVPYYAMITLLTEGHLWLKNEFNYSIESAWSIDSFGHSSTFAYLLKNSGIKRIFIQRTHYALKKYLAFKKQIEFYWKQAWDDTVLSTEIFTHMSPFVLYSIQYSCGPDITVCCQYNFVKSQCWKNGHYQVADSITDQNVESRSLELLDQLRKKVQFVNHNHVMLMVGDDFSYKSHREWNKQWDNMLKIFNHLNSKPDLNVEVQFSTIGKYLKMAEEEMKVNNVGIPKLIGDFFPYSDRSDQYWSGFYVTRPYLKALIRKCQSYLRAADVFFGLVALEINGNQFKSVLFLKECYNKHLKLREEFGLYQHHDTITGTSRSGVVESTISKLYNFLSSLSTIFSLSTSLLFQEEGRINYEFFEMHEEKLPLLNPSEWSVLKVPQTLLIFNSLVKTRIEIVKLFVYKPDIRAIDHDGNDLLCQISPVFDYDFVLIEDFFQVEIQVTIKPLSLVQVKILESLKNDRNCFKAEVKTNFYLQQLQLPESFSFSNIKSQSFNVTNNFLEVHYDRGIMKEFVSKVDGRKYKADIKFASYSTNSWLKPFSDKSGAYIFLPNGHSLKIEESMSNVILIEGPLKSSVTTRISEEVHHTTEIFNSRNFSQQGIHITNVVDLRKKDNFELSMILETSIDNKHFFTDLNGYQIEKRTRRNKFPIQGNFYPITNMVIIEDTVTRLTLITGQSHAVSSLRKGEVEVLLDRRLLQDDWRGLGQGVKDNVPVISKFIIIQEQVKPFNQKTLLTNPSALTIENVLRTNNPLILLRQLSLSPTIDFFSTARIPLPCGVHLVSWRILFMNTNLQKMLITLHYFASDPNIKELNNTSSCFLRTVKIPVTTIVGEHSITKIYEMNLTGTKMKDGVVLNVLEISQMEIKTWLLIKNFESV